MKGNAKNSAKDPELSVKEWRQTEKDISIELEAGEGIGDNDVELTVNAKLCKLRLRDGREWQCYFYNDIDSNSCKYSIKDSVIEIQAHKLSKCDEWPTLQITEDGQTSEGPEEDDGKENDNEHVISHAKNDIFEKDATSLNLNVYVKQIIKESFDIDFQDELLTIRFSTKDNQFLGLNPPSTSDTIFKWTIHLKYAIIPEECTFKVLKTKLDICLKKKDPAKWNMLEKTQYKSNTASGGQKGKTTGGWVPLNSGARQKTLGSNGEKDVARGAVGGAKSVDAADNRTQKPTCAVPPLSLSHESNKQTGEAVAQYKKGFTGLDNLGNTCFMNSVIQVLANTRELKDYMLDNNVKDEINTDNPLGTGGHMVLSFAVLMRLLWSGKFRSYAPLKLKTVIATKASQFMGFAQHDAQEFMAFLLDGLHEDLNRIKEKPYTETVDSDGRPDEVVAEEAWATHKKRKNDSFIVDLFQGQYKSKLVCPECGKVSITFDPFMQLSVPLPKKKRHIPVYFFSKEHYKKPVKYLVPLTPDASVEELKAVMSQKTKVNSKNMRVFEVANSRVHKVFNRGSSLSSISINDIIYVCEVLGEKQVKERVVEVVVMQRLQMPPALNRCSNSMCRKDRVGDHVLKRCTKCLRAAYCDQMCQKEHWASHKITCKRRPEPVGSPFMISLPESHATYARLCQAMEAYARYSTNVFQPPITAQSTNVSPDKSSQSSPEDPDRLNEPSTSSEWGAGEPSSSTGVSSCSQESIDMEASSSSSASEEQLSEDSAVGESVMDQSEDGASTSAAGANDDVKNGNEVETKEDDGVDGKTAMVVGQPQLPERTMPPFFIKPVNMSGNGLPGPLGDRLGDKGDEPLDLSRYDYLAMDWRNDPKQQNHVLAESKELEYEDDESMYHTIDSEKNITVDQCLQLFTKPEKLAPDEAWYCPKCKQHREATKEMSLWRLPCNLIIQLKRFSFKNMIWRDKIDKMVYYPTRGLDLTPYCHGYKGGIPPVYDLYGVINHHGGILGGHYTSFARLPSREDWGKNENDWRLFDDSHVTMASEKNVLTHSAYLLFYRLRQPCQPYIPPPIATTTAPPKKDTKPKAVIKGSTAQVRNPKREAVAQEKHPINVATEKKETVSSANIPVAASTVTAATATAAASPQASAAVDDKAADPEASSCKDQETELSYTNMEDID
ncbi:ubiquitin carboxyl-terminal hydrolase 19-like [Amphiura filiformis]|uniref:ubiquitin carboxyl-terminal hydrolase 19-like n=1 Tax=Amphiura filiformis TaxID=82378 RepID=UPI003B216694